MQNHYGLKWYQNKIRGQRALFKGRRAPKMNQRAGFTMMELMMCIAIIGILATIVIPSGLSWRRNAEFNSAVREVKANIERQRMFAVRSNIQADVVFVNNANTFTTVRRTRNGGVLAAVNQVHQLPAGITISAPAFFNAVDAASLFFNNRGMATNGAVTINGPGGLSNTITVSVAGSSQVQ